jgi:DNA-binding MarR family transcriptional regulator
MARHVDHPESEPFRLADSASHLLHRAEQIASDRFSRLFETVTLRQFAVLAAIDEEPGLSQSALVRATGIDRSTLADMMNRLAKRGLVVRTPSASDARAYSVKLTKTGADVLHNATLSARAADAAILDLLPRTKRKAFLATLTKLSRLAEQAAQKAEREAKRKEKRELRARLKREKTALQKAKVVSARGSSGGRKPPS